MERLFQGQDVFDIIELTRQHEVPFTLEGYRESQSEGLAAVVDIVALVAVGMGARVVETLPQTDVPYANTVIEELCTHARTLIDLAGVLSFTIEGSPADTALTPLAAQLRLAEIMIRNKHYLSVGRQLNEGVLGPPGNDKLLAAKLGFTYEDVLRVSEAITLGYQQAKVGDLDTLGRTAKWTSEGFEPYAGQLEAAQKSFDRLFVHPGPASAFTAAEIAASSGLEPATVSAVLDTFSISMPLANPIALVESFCNGKNPLAGKDLVHDGQGNYLLLQSGIPDDQIRRVIDLRVKSLGDSKAWDRYSKQRDSFAEKKAAELMAKALGVPAPQHTGLKYLAPPKDDAGYDLSRNASNPKQLARVVEGDSLFIVDDVAICMEVKAGSITDKARSGNVQRVAQDLRKTIGEATTQAQRLEQLILTHGGLWQESGKWLDLAGVREVRTVVACLDDFGPLAIAADTLVRANMIGGTTLPWIISLHDLEIATKLLQTPESFLLYLRRRTEPQAARMFEAVDELDVLMWFVQGGLYFDPDPDELYRRYPTGAKPTGASRARFKRESFTTIGTLTDTLDAWMYHEDGITQTAASKPQRREHPLLQSIVDKLRTENASGWLRVGADLFNLSEAGQAELANKITHIIELTRLDKSFHSLAEALVTPWGYSAFFVGTQPFGNLGARGRLEIYAAAKKHQLKADRALAVLLNEDGDIAWSGYNNDPWGPNEELDQLGLEMGLVPVQEMDRNPPPSARRPTRRLNPGKKRGRRR
ncbi:hypothetical protein U2F26_35470 [Micromonospora sp. 4G57]|uniref:Uncharacterized protein n=1 Tax=Micromonospora sicca TaxID=2202420 RepID=A0ABU5JQ05_9ACTN|nr:MULTISPECIES: hypothetical protein [unclassified Micromonospora]MDZ5447930.1 hypothetical protein [Micromonospora sp. 4G57]MDZ5494676.1 hypothetical protein [Micromonospora sp. 4G53]